MADSYDARVNGFIDPALANELSATLAAEIEALTGCDPKAAKVAAGAYVNCRRAPGFGLCPTASDDPLTEARAIVAIEAWIAAQARKAA